jgi:hypothetical protein
MPPAAPVMTIRFPANRMPLLLGSARRAAGDARSVYRTGGVSCPRRLIIKMTRFAFRRSGRCRR